LDILREIRKLSKTGAYEGNVILLRSVPGVGLITSMVILTEIETIERFNNLDKLCNYIGFVPSTHSSGEKEKTGDITPRGHSILRSAIVESTWNAIRYDPALTKSFHDYCKRMDSNKAIIRIAKKLVSRIRFVLKNKQPYVLSLVK
jgi:transposase